MSVGVIVLGAGKGTRMRSDTAKVLHEACGRTLLAWVLGTVEHLDVERSIVVVGHQAESVTATLPPGVDGVVQEPQNGTGHAVRVALDGFGSLPETIVVLPGDMPLITGEAVSSLISHHRAAGASATIMSVELDDPTGYGRIVRDGDAVSRIVEEGDATEDERSIAEVNTSVYVFRTGALVEALDQITIDNVQGEYYLTDVIEILDARGDRVTAMTVAPELGIGVNTHAQLAQVSDVLRRRITSKLLDSGVWMLDPQRVYIDATVTIEPTAKLYPDVYLTGSTTVAAGASIGPNVEARDTAIGAGAVVKQAVMMDAMIGRDALVGPFAYLRPGAVLEDGSKVGTYVEVKGSTVGAGSKVPHLSYIGDTTIGENTNIGAGTITVNYDGYAKHKTTIGDRVRIGSDTMLVAPVIVGDDALTGAGSVITHDVPEGALGISRDPQRNVDGYAEKRRKRAEREQD